MGAAMLKESEEEIREVSCTIQKSEAKLKCFNCSRWKRDIESTYICFECKCYACLRCVYEHNQHDCFNGICEGSERERQIESYLRVMKNEPNREGLFKKEEVSIIYEANVKHHLDKKPCFITGLCGMDNAGWVACDNANYCIKLFNGQTHELQRIIRVLPQPIDVIEIMVKQKSTDPISSQGSCKTNITVTHQSEPKHDCLLAVTLLEVKEIWFIDVNQIPAVKTKSIKLQKQCWSVNFCEDQIFTLCSKKRSGYLWFLYILSTEGDTKRIISTDIHTIHKFDLPRIVVGRGTIYLADRTHDKVTCINEEGNVIAQTGTPQGSLKGVSVDPYDNNVNLHVLDKEDDQTIYQLNSSLDRCETVIGSGPLDMKMCSALCMHRGKLYTSHLEKSRLSCYVIITRIV